MSGGKRRFLLLRGSTGEGAWGIEAYVWLEKGILRVEGLVAAEEEGGSDFGV